MDKKQIRKQVFEQLLEKIDFIEMALRDEFMDMLDEAEQEAEAGEIMFDEIDDETGQGYVYFENVDSNVDMAIHNLWEAGQSLRLHLETEY